MADQTPDQAQDQAKGSATNVIGISTRRAKKLIADGLEKFSAGEVREAISCFRQSLEICESAEGLTNMAWMLSFSGQLDAAIELCKRAIEVDPDFGNPYNDIGTYHMKKGDLEAAIPWLEKAKVSRRYEPRHYPYLNLGRIYLTQGMFLKALTEFEHALKFDPENTELRSVIARIRQGNHTR